MIISLTGFMGCGKSSVGSELSKLLFCPFMDLDSVIENKYGRTIPEIFASEGESGFRKMELETLEEIISGNEDNTKDLVLALGGGAVMTKKCAEMIHQKTLCIYLRASIDTLISRLISETDGRPLLSGTAENGSERESGLRNRISSLMELRTSTYEETAHIILDTDGRSIGTIAEEIRLSAIDRL